MISNVIILRICMCFGTVGFVQLVKRRSLLRVDSDILLLGAYVEKEENLKERIDNIESEVQSMLQTIFDYPYFEESGCSEEGGRRCRRSYRFLHTE